MAVLSSIDIKRILRNDKKNSPSDDFRIIDSWAEYTENPDSNKRRMKYLCYEIQTIDPLTGEITHFYKALRFLRVLRVPREAKESLSLMDKQTQVLAAVCEQGMNMITVIANVLEPKNLGLLFLYGAQGVSEDIEVAKQKVDSDFVGLRQTLQGTYRVMHARELIAQESEWLREKMFSMDYMTVIRGIPKANRSGEDAGNKGFGGKNINPDSQGTLEEIIAGMTDYEYVIQVLSSPVYLDTLEAWQTKTQKAMTKWNGQLQGTKSISANISLPMAYMANASTSQGWSHGYTDARGVSLTNGESFTNTLGHSVGNSISHTFGQSLTQTRGTSITDGISKSVSVGHSTSAGRSFGTSQSVSNNISNSSGTNQSSSIGTSQNQGTSFNRGTSQSFGVSVNDGTSISKGSSQSFGQSHTDSVSNGSSWNHGTNTSHSANISHGTSEGYGTSFGSGKNENTSASLNSGDSHGNNNSLSGGLSALGGSINASTGSSDTANMGWSASKSEGVSQSMSASHNTGTSNSFSVGSSSGVSNSVGGSHSTSSSNGTSVTQGFSESIGQNHSVGHSSNLGQSESMGMSFSNGASQSQSNGFSNSTSIGSGSSSGTNIGNSVSESNSVTHGTSTSHSVGQSRSTSVGESQSTGRSESISDSTSVSKGSSTSRGTSINNSISNGTSGTIGMGSSGSMGLAPSLGYNKSYQWLDQEVKDILELLDFQNERLKYALRGSGAFYTFVYIACSSLDALSAAKMLAKSTWQNEYAMIQPLQVLDLSPEEQKHLLYHFSAFSNDVTRETYNNVTSYKYCTILLPKEFTAYTHIPRISEGGIISEAMDIPHFASPSMMEGEIYMGSIVSPERYSMVTGDYVTNRDYRIDDAQLMHGFFTGASRSGKTVAAMRFVAELTKVHRKESGKRLRIVCMDPKRDWRALARFVEPERFRFYSMGNPNFHPLHFNPCKIPKNVAPQQWIDVMIEIFCRAYGLLERGKQMMAETFYALYEREGVFEAYGKEGWQEEVPRLSANVTFSEAYKEMNKQKLAMDTGTSSKGRGGNDTKDAYSRLLERLSAFARPYSVECRLFGQADGMSIDDMIGADDVTVLESKGLEATFKNFIFGIITAGFYRYAIHQERGFLSRDQYETVLIIEEANEVLTGNDSASGGSQMGLSGQSEFEQILDQAAGWGLYIFAITQKIADMPKSIIANSSMAFAGRVVTEDDINVVVKSIARDPRMDDRDVAKWFPRAPTGFFVCKSSRTYSFLDAEPVLIKVAMLPISTPTDRELDEILVTKKMKNILEEVNKSS